MQQPEGIKVAVLLSTLNGAEHLSEQLDSIARQTHQNWVIHICDAGSSDGTVGMIERYRETLGANRLIVHRKPGGTASGIWMYLLRNKAIKADLYALAGQSDIWYDDKLARSVGGLLFCRSGEPGLYCARSRLINADAKVVGESPLLTRPPTFGNALVQRLGNPHSMVFNEATRKLLCAAPKRAKVAALDWLIYLLVTGCEGRIAYDSEPVLDYRVRGAADYEHMGLLRLPSRITQALSGVSRRWNDENLTAIRLARKHFSDVNLERLANFERARGASLWKRAHLLRRADARSRSVFGNLGFYLMASLRGL
ncbi:glycosyltransferase [Pseudomonas sp. Marseille-QA0892]